MISHATQESLTAEETEAGETVTWFRSHGSEELKLSRGSLLFLLEQIPAEKPNLNMGTLIF